MLDVVQAEHLTMMQLHKTAASVSGPKSSYITKGVLLSAKKFLTVAAYATKDCDAQPGYAWLAGCTATAARHENTGKTQLQEHLID